MTEHKKFVAGVVWSFLSPVDLLVILLTVLCFVLSKNCVVLCTEQEYSMFVEMGGGNRWLLVNMCQLKKNSVNALATLLVTDLIWHL